MNNTMNQSAVAKTGARTEPLPRRAVRALGEMLKTEFGAVVDEPVPAHFLDLLEKLNHQTCNRQENAAALTA